MVQSSPQKPMFSAPDYSKPQELWLTEPDTLRRLVGILGMALPIMLPFFLWMDTKHVAPLESISHYYFTRVSTVFTTVVSLMAIFLLIYKGQSPREFWLSTAAGVGALLLVLFPTDNIVKGVFYKIGQKGIEAGLGKGCDSCMNSLESAYTTTFLRDSTFRMDFHYIASGVFLLSLALLAFFVFAYSKKEIAAATDAAAILRMQQRNLIYRVCGALMVLAVAFVLWGDKIVGDTFYKANHLTFWMETIAVEAFGFSWLLRGDMLLPDKGNVLIS